MNSSIDEGRTGCSSVCVDPAGVAAAQHGSNTRAMIAEAGQYPVSGRSEAYNHRLAIHEGAGHAYLARCMGTELQSVSISFRVTDTKVVAFPKRISPVSMKRLRPRPWRSSTFASGRND
jgi:hypothetical protein